MSSQNSWVRRALGIPQLYRPVVRGGGDLTPIGAERHTSDNICMTAEQKCRFPYFGIPDTHTLIHVSADDPISIGAISETIHCDRGTTQVENFLTSVGIPNHKPRTTAT